jgi:hypothetical protein
VTRFVIVKTCRLVDIYFVEAPTRAEAEALVDRAGNPNASACLDPLPDKTFVVRRFPRGVIAQNEEGSWLCDERGEPAELTRTDA